MDETRNVSDVPLVVVADRALVGVCPDVVEVFADAASEAPELAPELAAE